VLAVTDLIATLPRRLADLLARGGGFEIFELPVQIPSAAVTMHWHEHFHEDEGIAWMRDLLVNIMQRFAGTAGAGAAPRAGKKPALKRPAPAKASASAKRSSK
jgi:hypothetical protein